MNAQRRKDLDKARELLSEAQAIIQQAAEDERSYYDAMPEALQGADKGTKADEVADALSQLADELSTADSTLDEAQQ